MDLNLSHGSHYINTDNYPNFENDVQESIINVMSQYNIHKDDVVLYGGSKGEQVLFIIHYLEIIIL